MNSFRFNVFLYFITVTLFFGCTNKNFSENNKFLSRHEIEIRLQNRVENLKSFIKSNSNFNNQIAFLLDMRVMSGKNRFFVYDLKSNKILHSGLVAHGSGSETEVEGELKFSNVNNSYCTSLGKYSIGNSYIGQYGKAYKLHGLDKTNDNAFARNIVLHKYKTMPFEEQDSPIVNSLGCPMVHPKFYKILEKYIDNSKSKILLEIYY